MSEQQLIESELSKAEQSARFARVAVSLLKEYAEKLRSFCDQSEQARERFAIAKEKGDRDEMSFLRQISQSRSQRAKEMITAVSQLARRVSQRLEHGALDESDRIELEVRLAELEQMIRLAGDVTRLTKIQ